MGGMNSPKWQPAPMIKLYEALGTLADARIEVHGNSAKVYSSSGNKYYEVEYDPVNGAITANDNGSYWVGYLGYPSIAFLLAAGVIQQAPGLADQLKGFAWKDINTRFKNNFDKTQAYIDEQVAARGGDILQFHQSLAKLLEQVNDLKLAKLPSNKQPPKGY
jgi:hypothetical protein